MRPHDDDAPLAAIIAPFSDTDQQIIQLWAEGLAKILPSNTPPQMRAAIFAYAAKLPPAPFPELSEDRAKWQGRSAE